MWSAHSVGSWEYGDGERVAVAWVPYHLTQANLFSIVFELLFHRPSYNGIFTCMFGLVNKKNTVCRGIIYFFECELLVGIK